MLYYHKPCRPVFVLSRALTIFFSLPSFSLCFACSTVIVLTLWRGIAPGEGFVLVDSSARSCRGLGEYHENLDKEVVDLSLQVAG
jgi:hypothetical protein